MPPEPRERRLADLLPYVDGSRLVRGSGDSLITGVTHDTRLLRAGELFVAIPGLERDGLAFIPQALARGAAAIVAESSVAAASCVVQVPNARRALAELAAAFFDHPSRRLPVVGITGTDGKTSTTHLLSAILEAHGLATGWLTTVNTKIGAELRPNAVDHTTPEAPVVQRTLADMALADLDVALLEVSSHALELDRVHAVDFRVGVFTNLSPEHLNFHGTFEAYRAAKVRLFERLPANGRAVLNADDVSSAFVQSATVAPVVTFGFDPCADIRAADVHLAPNGTTFILQPAGLRIESRLLGRFNVSNWLAALAAATYFGATPHDLVTAARAQQPVPGRMNLVDRGQPFAVVVDFAHTPQALANAIAALRDLDCRRLLLTFGMAGARDAANRPVMGKLAAETSDFFVITMDDPGREDPATIAHQVARGAESAGAAQGERFAIELDRRTAIRALLERALPGDVVLLAGKGHEQRMVVGDTPQPWNDARVATDELERLGYRKQAVP
jgi:UDP-N-acetylmuramoyl-L-alanyl-D-glutamate--2,6-diaminopimelate ligase